MLKLQGTFFIQRMTSRQVSVFSETTLHMKKAFYILLVVLIAASACASKYSFNSYEGKKKLKYYNSVQYGNTQYPNAKRKN